MQLKDYYEKVNLFLNPQYDKSSNWSPLDSNFWQFCVKLPNV
jgi:hypothetical protein